MLSDRPTAHVRQAYCTCQTDLLHISDRPTAHVRQTYFPTRERGCRDERGQGAGKRNGGKQGTAEVSKTLWLRVETSSLCLRAAEGLDPLFQLGSCYSPPAPQFQLLLSTSKHSIHGFCVEDTCVPRSTCGPEGARWKICALSESAAARP